MDLSALRKFEVRGPDAEELLQRTCTRNIRKLSVGQVVYTAMCYDHGGMLDDGTVFKMTHDNFRWICGDEYCGEWLRNKAKEMGLKVWIKSSTDNLHNVSVRVLRVEKFLKRLFGLLLIKLL
jgi:aminomethyltransferase